MHRFLYVFRRLSPTETLFKASAVSKRKENSPQARLPCDLPLSTALQRQIPTDGFRNVGPNSLSPVARETTETTEMAQQLTRPFQGGFPRGLGPTYPCPSTVHMETYSASVFRVLNRIIATTTKICTRYTIARRLTPNASARAPRPPTRLWLKLPDSRRTIGDLLKHRPFSGLVHSAGELLHTPWPIPTSMATALLSI